MDLALKLLMHRMRHWPQMVDTMFWPFAIKAMAERLNSLHMDNDSNTPESIMFGVNLDLIPVKNFYTLITAFNLLVDPAH
jgi:hypothetical protein